MLSMYMAVRVRPLPRLPPPEQNGCGPSTLMSPLRKSAASPFCTPCHWNASSEVGMKVEKPSYGLKMSTSLGDQPDPSYTRLATHSLAFSVSSRVSWLLRALPPLPWLWLAT